MLICAKPVKHDRIPRKDTVKSQKNARKYSHTRTEKNMKNHQNFRQIGSVSLESIIYERQVYSNKYDDLVIKNKLFST